MRLMLPEQPVRWSCPATGETRSGTIREPRHGIPLRYYVEAAGGVRLCLDADTLVPVPRRPRAEKPTAEMGVHGGQGHSGAELLRAAAILDVLVLLPIAVLCGWGGARLIAHAADIFGAAYLSN